jgi:hypothetical protein
MTIIVSSKNKKAESTKRDMIVQTGRITSHETLLWDLETIEGLTVKVQHLDAEFIGGGQANFLTLSLDKPQLPKLAEAINKHIKRLKPKEEDDLVLLMGGRMKFPVENVQFSDVQCRQQLKLKAKKPEEIQDLLIEAFAEAGQWV